MYRTPPRRHPRVAAAVRTGSRWTAVVRDAWEVRAATTGATLLDLWHLILRERPAAVAVAGRVPPALARLARCTARSAPRELPTLDSAPELRRFAGTRAERAMRKALVLAEQELHDPIFQN